MFVMERSTLVPLLLICVGVMSGCSRDDLQRMVNKETYMFEGIYDNQYDQQLLVFKDGKVAIQDAHGDAVWQRPFDLDDDELTIQMSQNSKEQRPELVMRVHGKGEVLTCSACARYQLSNIWVREGAEAQNVELPGENQS